MKMTLTIKDQTFDVEVGDLDRRPVQVWVNGKEYEVWPEEVTSSASPSAHPAVKAVQAATSLAAAPQSASAGKESNGTGYASEVNKGKVVTAPIPGVILSVGVKKGDAVTFGQELCVLEAMKMKNQIRANRSGTVAAVKVSAGDQVKQNQVLLEYAD